MRVVSKNLVVALGSSSSSRNVCGGKRGEWRQVAKHAEEESALQPEAKLEAPADMKCDSGEREHN